MLRRASETGSTRTSKCRLLLGRDRPDLQTPVVLGAGPHAQAKQPLAVSSRLSVDVVHPVDLFGIGFDGGQVQVDDYWLLTAAHDDAR